MRAKRISCALLGLAAALTLAAQPLAAQTPKAQPHTGAPKSARPLTKAAAKAPALTPLNDRERVVQLLDRFTFGVRPGDVERVLAGGEDAWVAQQMSPASRRDAACDKRLAQYPTLNLSPAQALNIFPDRPQIGAVADGKAPY